VTRIDFPYLMSDRDRHGNERLYVRRHGHKIRIRATPGTSSTPMPTPCTPLPRETSLIAQLSKVRQQARSGGLQRVILLPSDLMRDCPLSVLSPAHVKMLRDRRAAKPGAANNRRKYLSSMFGWAVEHGLLRLNPAREVRRVRYATAGFHTWTVDEVRQYEQRHPIGGPLQRPRSPQGRCDHSCGEWSNRSAVDGAVRLDVRETGQRLYCGRKSQAPCRSGSAINRARSDSEHGSVPPQCPT
jgi:hypothetical protein